MASSPGEPASSTTAEQVEHDSVIEASREQRLARTFVELADTMVDDFDLIDFLRMLVEHCVALLEVSQAAVVLADQHGDLRMAAASSEQTELLEMLAVQAEEGPCIECVRGGGPVASSDLLAEAPRWPRFVRAAEAGGFRAAQALPMRLRGQVIGVLTLLNRQADGVGEDSSRIGQALADTATIGILQQRAIERGELVIEQLETALDSRVVIEQAKGILAARGQNLDMEQAFRLLRGHARAHNQRLSELARAVTENTADVAAILSRAAEQPS